MATTWEPGAHRRTSLRALVVLAAFVMVCGLVATAPIAASLVADPDDPSQTVPASSGSVAPTAPATDPPVTAEPTTPPDQTVPQTSAWTAPNAADQWSAPAGGASGDQWTPDQRTQDQFGATAGSDEQGAAVSETTDPPMTTTEDLLVGPSTTRAAATTVPPRDVAGTSVTRTGGSSDPKIWAVVAGLGLVAIALGAATVIYWRRTRPLPVSSGGSDAPRRGPRGRSRSGDLVVTSPDL